jgi:hypothetical protein
MHAYTSPAHPIVPLFFSKCQKQIRTFAGAVLCGEEYNRTFHLTGLWRQQKYQREMRALPCCAWLDDQVITTDYVRGVSGNKSKETRTAARTQGSEIHAQLDPRRCGRGAAAVYATTRLRVRLKKILRSQQTSLALSQ